MKVILTRDIKGTGKKGDVIEVRDGYGRNFLLPRGLALPASEGNIKRFEHIIKEFEKKKERQIKTAGEIKAKLEEITLNIKKKAGQDGRLFGSVTPQELSDLIKKETGLYIEKKKIRIDEPIKSIGMHTFGAQIEKGIIASVKLEVEKEA
ncbi:MAG TPA: 50S ribosomal protein L9 [Syntrophorhabdaceae bacterium]|nr:50S ribosomal protein L9 [Syntrophorhabdaceae bacterium]HPU30643.1 50S ribosomal protein L9 [Syntrophorhabdaceae bacterium]